MRNSRHFVLLSLAISGLVAAGRTASAQTELDAALALDAALTKTIAEAEASVVSIARIRIPDDRNPVIEVNPFGFRNRGNEFPDLPGNPESPQFVPNEFGAGVVLARTDHPDDRFVLTNYHVVKGGPISGNPARAASQLYVRFPSGRGCYASIRAADPRSDLAVLELNFEQLGLKPDELTPLRFSDKYEIRKGQIVIALGNPLAIARDGSASAAWGIISNIGRAPAPPQNQPEGSSPPNELLHHTGTLLQVDLKLNLGTSGGALLNLRGEFVGLTTSLAALEGYESSSGFAIPTDERFRRIIDALSRGEEVEYGFLGVAPQNTTAAEVRRRGFALGQPTAPLLLQVFQNSPASRGGLLSGDFVLSIEGETTLTSLDLMRVVSLLPPDSIANIRVWRPGERRHVAARVRLGKWPVFDDEALIATHPRLPAWRGLRVDYPTARFRFLQRSSAYPDAVLIVAVEEQTPAAEQKLQNGEYIVAVNGTVVATPGEFHAVVAKVSGPATLRFLDGREIILSEPVSGPTPNP